VAAAYRNLIEMVPGVAIDGAEEIVRAGLDADVVVFDAAAITDRASAAHSTRPSAGIRHVLMNGTFVVGNGDLMQAALPGWPIRAEPR
jgi:N-acyl-D-aspartate/D-glutamate deacylase